MNVYVNTRNLLLICTYNINNNILTVERNIRNNSQWSVKSVTTVTVYICMCVCICAHMHMSTHQLHPVMNTQIHTML